MTRPKKHCGACGAYVLEFRLVDVSQHLLKKLRPYGTMCDGCVSRLIRPGRKWTRRGIKPVKKSVFLRGLPGSKTTRLAHVKRQQAKAKPELDYRP